MIPGVPPRPPGARSLPVERPRPRPFAIPLRERAVRPSATRRRNAGTRHRGAQCWRERLVLSPAVRVPSPTTGVPCQSRQRPVWADHSEVRARRAYLNAAAPREMPRAARSSRFSSVPRWPGDDRDACVSMRRNRRYRREERTLSRENPDTNVPAPEEPPRCVLKAAEASDVPRHLGEKARVEQEEPPPKPREHWYRQSQTNSRPPSRVHPSAAMVPASLARAGGVPRKEYRDWDFANSGEAGSGDV